MRLYKVAFIGFCITVGLLLIPIIHFVSGPLGPAIGGFIAGSKAKVTPGESLLVGTLMGIFSLSIILPILWISSLFFKFQSFWIILTIISFGYISTLGLIGALIGGNLANQKKDVHKNL